MPNPTSQIFCLVNLYHSRLFYLSAQWFFFCIRAHTTHLFIWRIVHNCSSLNFPCIAKNQLSIYGWIYYWTLICPFIHLSILMPIPLSYSSFISLKTRKCESSNFDLFQSVFCYFILLYFHLNFGINLTIPNKKLQKFYRCCIGSIY